MRLMTNKNKSIKSNKSNNTHRRRTKTKKRYILKKGGVPKQATSSTEVQDFGMTKM